MFLSLSSLDYTEYIYIYIAALQIHFNFYLHNVILCEHNNDYLEVIRLAVW